MEEHLEYLLGDIEGEVWFKYLFRTWLDKYSPFMNGKTKEIISNNYSFFLYAFQELCRRINREIKNLFWVEFDRIMEIIVKYISQKWGVTFSFQQGSSKIVFFEEAKEKGLILLYLPKEKIMDILQSILEKERRIFKI